MIDLLEDELQYTYTTVNKLDYMIHKQLLSRVPKKSASPCLFVQKYIYNTIHTYIYILPVCMLCLVCRAYQTPPKCELPHSPV